MQFTIAKTQQELRAALTELWREKGSVALVPTMGGLHKGHQLLMDVAHQYGGVVVYIFVNPFQFNDEKDFTSYPRNAEADIEACREAGVDVLYMPSAEDVYPPDFGTLVSMGGMTETLEGMFRPGHFNGVATVLTKMFIRVLPNAAIFGEKDYQQLLVVSRLVRDLDLPIEIIGVQTMREKNGLAMSSRNARLSAAELEVAGSLYAVLLKTAKELAEKPDNSEEPLKNAFKNLIDAGFSQVDYVALCDAATLEPMKKLDRPARLLAAAHLGNTRLIDNIPVQPK